MSKRKIHMPLHYGSDTTKCNRYAPRPWRQRPKVQAEIAPTVTCLDCLRKAQKGHQDSIDNLVQRTAKFVDLRLVVDQQIAKVLRGDA